MSLAPLKAGFFLCWGAGLTTVVGFHGTVRSSAEILLTPQPFKVRTNGYDWLGTGVYFWQESALRAKVWARSIATLSDEPVVLAADLDLSECLDLFDLKDYNSLRRMYPRFLELEGSTSPLAQAGLVVQRGRQYTTDDSSSDPLTRMPIRNFRDCAFLDWAVEKFSSAGRRITSIRSAFVSGNALFEESFLFDWSHSQIAVLEPVSVIQNLREV
jgi:hypothetical protein